MNRPIVIAVLVGIVLLAGAYLALNRHKTSVPADAMERGAVGDSDFMASFASSFHDSCESSAKNALTSQGIDPTSEGNAAKIDAYCGCAIDSVRSDLSVTEIMAFNMNSASEPAASKMKTITKECGDKTGKFER